MRIGIISDTHGLLRPEAERALQGVDLIVHAGDVGDPENFGQTQAHRASICGARQCRYLAVGAGIACDHRGRGRWSQPLRVAQFSGSWICAPMAAISILSSVATRTSPDNPKKMVSFISIQAAPGPGDSIFV